MLSGWSCRLAGRKRSEVRPSHRIFARRAWAAHGPPPGRKRARGRPLAVQLLQTNFFRTRSSPTAASTVTQQQPSVAARRSFQTPPNVLFQQQHLQWPSLLAVVVAAAVVVVVRPEAVAAVVVVILTSFLFPNRAARNARTSAALPLSSR